MNWFGPGTAGSPLHIIPLALPNAPCVNVQNNAQHLTLITWRAVAVLPQPSVAVQVLVTTCLNPVLQSVSTVVSLSVTVTPPPQLSVPGTLAGETDASQSTSTFAGTPTNTGGVWSNVQVTVLDAVDELPQPSVDDHVLV